MLFLIHQQILWLLLTALAAGVAGWAWHKWRHSTRGDELDAQRDVLRRELVSLVAGGGDDGASELAREVDALRARANLRDARIAELENRLEEARAAREETVALLAEFERGGVPVEAEPAELEPDLSHWRTRYLEARVRHLEGLPPAAPQMEPTVRADLDAALARIAELEASIEAMGASAANGDELNRLRWQSRYLDARVRYLESPGALAPLTPAEEPEDEEAAKRRAWRQRYLETRAAHLAEAAGAAQQSLDAAQAAARAAEAELAARDQRIAELSALEATAQKARRLAWRARYLDARVRHLEQKLATPAVLAAGPPVVDREEEPAPAQLVPPGAEERPPALPAAHGGAPDDLTLIEGVTPMQQSTLHALGVFHFEQLGAWTPANVAWVDQYLRLRGRITQERWVEQAAALARNERAEPRPERV